MEEMETFGLVLKEPAERTIPLPFPKHHTLGALEDRIDEITSSEQGWPHFRRDQFLIIVRGTIINERYASNVKLQDIQGFDSLA